MWRLLALGHGERAAALGQGGHGCVQALGERQDLLLQLKDATLQLPLPLALTLTEQALKPASPAPARLGTAWAWWLDVP